MKHVVLLVGRDDGIVLPYMGIEYENAVWLVTAWLKNLSLGKATPERMIRIDSYQKVDVGPFDYANILLPKDVIEGHSQESQLFEVRSLPDSPIVDSIDLKPLPLFP